MAFWCSSVTISLPLRFPDRYSSARFFPAGRLYTAAAVMTMEVAPGRARPRLVIVPMYHGWDGPEEHLWSKASAIGIVLPSCGRSGLTGEYAIEVISLSSPDDFMPSVVCMKCDIVENKNYYGIFDLDNFCRKQEPLCLQWFSCSWQCWEKLLSCRCPSAAC